MEKQIMNRYICLVNLRAWLPLCLKTCQSIALLILNGLLCFLSVIVYADDSRVEILNGKLSVESAKVQAKEFGKSATCLIVLPKSAGENGVFCRYKFGNTLFRDVLTDTIVSTEGKLWSLNDVNDEFIDKFAQWFKKKYDSQLSQDDKNQVKNSLQKLALTLELNEPHLIELLHLTKETWFAFIAHSTIRVYLRQKVIVTENTEALKHLEKPEMNTLLQIPGVAKALATEEGRAALSGLATVLSEKEKTVDTPFISKGEEFKSDDEINMLLLAVGAIFMLGMVLLLSLIIRYHLRKGLAFLDELQKESSQLKSWKSTIEVDVLFKLLPDAKEKSPEDFAAAVEKMRSQLAEVTGKGDESTLQAHIETCCSLVRSGDSVVKELGEKILTFEESTDGLLSLAGQEQREKLTQLIKEHQDEHNSLKKWKSALDETVIPNLGGEIETADKLRGAVENLRSQLNGVTKKDEETLLYDHITYCVSLVELGNSVVEEIGDKLKFEGISTDGLISLAEQREKLTQLIKEHQDEHNSLKKWKSALDETVIPNLGGEIETADKLRGAVENLRSQLSGVTKKDEETLLHDHITYCVSLVELGDSVVEEIGDKLKFEGISTDGLISLAGQREKLTQLIKEYQDEHNSLKKWKSALDETVIPNLGGEIETADKLRGAVENLRSQLNGVTKKDEETLLHDHITYCVSLVELVEEIGDKLEFEGISTDGLISLAEQREKLTQLIKEHQDEHNRLKKWKSALDETVIPNLGGEIETADKLRGAVENLRSQLNGVTKKDEETLLHDHITYCVSLVELGNSVVEEIGDKLKFEGISTDGLISLAEQREKLTQLIKEYQDEHNRLKKWKSALDETVIPNLGGEIETADKLRDAVENLRNQLNGVTKKDEETLLHDHITYCVSLVELGNSVVEEIGDKLEFEGISTDGLISLAGQREKLTQLMEKHQKDQKRLEEWQSFLDTLNSQHLLGVINSSEELLESIISVTTQCNNGRDLVREYNKLLASFEKGKINGLLDIDKEQLKNFHDYLVEWKEAV
jgi:cell division FtsZ-interacting protein ZapD